MHRICLVTPSHPASNPRLVKEAEALLAAGYDVHVVAGRYFPPLDPFDEEIYRDARWNRTRVDYSAGFRVTLGKLHRRFARYRLARGIPPTLSCAMRAHHVAIPQLAAAAARVRADLYIGHCLAGLAAAGLAAERTGAKLGFDAEDFHPAETDEASADPVEIASIKTIESHWLPRCVHLTAASPLIAAAYRDRYGIREPVTVLNVFPSASAPSAPVTPASGGPARLYWFSQTLGPGRGLELLLPVLARMSAPCSLHLRGLPSPGFPEALQTAAKASGFTGPIEFLPIAPADDMIRLAAPYDLGLSLEQSSPLNRDLCLTNKVFTYLLAGIPQLMTPTAAHRDFAPSLGDAALVGDLANRAKTAAQLDAWLANPARVASSRRTAWRLARERYCWDVEQTALVAAVRQALA